MNKKILGLLALSVISSQPMQALTKKQVVSRAAVLGLAAGAGTYWAFLPNGRGLFGTQWEWPLKETVEGFGVVEQNYWFNEQARKSTIGSLAAFAGTGSFFAWIFSHWTARSRYRWAQKQLEQLENSSLYWVRMDKANIVSILQKSGCESKDLPLVAAFEQLRSHDRAFRSIEEQLIKALEDAGRKSQLGRKIRRLLKRVTRDLQLVRANEAFVKSHDKTAWLEQWKVHEKRKMERERFRQQALLAMQPLSHLHGHYVYHR